MLSMMVFYKSSVSTIHMLTKSLPTTFILQINPTFSFDMDTGLLMFTERTTNYKILLSKVTYVVHLQVYSPGVACGLNNVPDSTQVKLY